MVLLSFISPLLTLVLLNVLQVLSTQSNSIGISKKISGVERTRLRVIAKTLQPKGYGLTVRTVATGHSLEELQKDLEGLLSTWKAIIEHAKSAALAADEGVEGAIPVLLHKALGQTLSVVQDYFNEKVNCSSSLILPFEVSAVVIIYNKKFLTALYFNKLFIELSYGVLWFNVFQVKSMVVDSPRTYHEVFAIDQMTKYVLIYVVAT